MNDKIAKMLLLVGAIGLSSILLIGIFSDDESGLLLLGLMFVGAAVLGPIVATGGLLRDSDESKHGKVALSLWRLLLMFVLAGGVYLVLVLAEIITPLG